MSELNMVKTKKTHKTLRLIKSWIRTFNGGLSLFCLIILFCIPIITQNSYYLGIFIIAAIFAIFAASWNFLTGFTGQVSFGHAIFLGIGGYVTAIFVRFLDWEWPPALLLGGLSTVVIAFLVGIPALRIKGPYLALATMALSVFIMQLFINEKLAFIFFGEPGIDRVPPISVDPVEKYLVYTNIMVISIIVMTLIGESNVGTIFKSIREDETGAEASGINVTKYKILAFMISGFFAGIAGGLFAMHFRNTTPMIFQPLYSFYAIIMTAIGGIAIISGSALGAYIFFILEAFLIDLWDPVFIFSIILIIIIRFATMGLLRPALERLKEFYDFIIGR
ncbi:MAG: branched-chain amino acid ABC transporter permease [Promethearchaeota archaeon]